MKKWLSAALILTLVFVALGCSSSKSASSDLTPDQQKEVAYSAVKIAEDKMNTIFAKDEAKDGTPIIDATTNTKEKAVEVLSSYFDKALAQKIADYYVTADKKDDQFVVKKDSFFPDSVLKSKMEDVQIEGKKEEYKITTKAGVYTVKWVKDQNKYIVSDVAKK